MNVFVLGGQPKTYLMQRQFLPYGLLGGSREHNVACQFWCANRDVKTKWPVAKISTLYGMSLLVIIVFTEIYMDQNFILLQVRFCNFIALLLLVQLEFLHLLPPVRRICFASFTLWQLIRHPTERSRLDLLSIRLGIWCNGRECPHILMASLHLCQVLLMGPT